MDRSNLLIGAGVLLGLGTLAYWLMNREGDTAASQPMTAAARVRTYTEALKTPAFQFVRPEAADEAPVYGKAGDRLY